MSKSDEIDSLVVLAWKEHDEGRAVTAHEVADGHRRSPQSYAVYLSRMANRGLVEMRFNRALDVQEYSVTDHGHTLLGASGPRVGDR